MSVSITVNFGDKIPLNLKYDCPDDGETYYAQAILKTKQGVILTTINMTDILNGQFTDNSYSMPNIDYVYSSYKLFTDALRTIPAEIAEGQDVFELSQDSAPDICDEDIEIKVNAEEVSLLVNSIQSVGLSVGSEEVSLVADNKDIIINIPEFFLAQLEIGINTVSLEIDCEV